MKPMIKPQVTLPTLNITDDSAGMPNLRQAFSTPMACAASATSSRNGNMMRLRRTASSYLPGTWRNPCAKRSTSCGLKATPRAHNAPTIMMMAVATRL